MSPPSLIIREAGPQDLETIVAFNLALAEETEEKLLDRAVLRIGVERALEFPDRLRYWVAEFDAELVGQTAVTREWSDWRCGWIWWLQSVYVPPNARGRGIFRSLYAHIHTAARESDGVIGLRLYVEQNNLAAQRTYERLGLKPAGYLVLEDFWTE